MRKVVCKHWYNNVDEWEIAICLLWEKKTATPTTPLRQNVILALTEVQCSGEAAQVYLPGNVSLCKRLPDGEHDAAGMGRGKEGRESTQDLQQKHLLSSTADISWACCQLWPSPIQKPQQKAIFLPPIHVDLLFLLYPIRFCLLFHIPRNYYLGLNWKWRSSYFSLFTRDFVESEWWQPTCDLTVGAVNISALPCSMIWDFEATVSG